MSVCQMHSGHPPSIQLPPYHFCRRNTTICSIRASHQQQSRAKAAAEVQRLHDQPYSFIADTPSALYPTTTKRQQTRTKKQMHLHVPQRLIARLYVILYLPTHAAVHCAQMHRRVRKVRRIKCEQRGRDSRCTNSTLVLRMRQCVTRSEALWGIAHDVDDGQALVGRR